MRALFAGGRSLIVCGPQDDPTFPAAVAWLARATRCPILADPLSGVRDGPQVDGNVIANYDNFIRQPATAEALAPHFVLRFGAPPTSKPLAQYLERHSSARQVVVSDGETWLDPDGSASEFVFADPVLFCEAISSACPGTNESDAAWLSAWKAAAERTATAIDEVLDGDQAMSEPRVVQRLAHILPEGALVYAGNSMPVRDFDSFWPVDSRERTILGNRGTSGIDGVVSSALGAGAAGGGPVVLVIGDISFYHDLNGLLAARRHGLDLLVVLINNDGGGIFSFLPQAERPEYFEELFGTPHGLDFRPFVEGHGGHFVRVDDWPAFGAAVRDGLSTGGLQVIEVPTERARNVELHRQVWRIVSDALVPTAAVG
jgi:2-succinyl-5-enolpyruvyl-6-hydroxy-3-cyclohexene-1-carboxylate synthase